jgi:membrane protein YqaA with SNARE-associated domain
LRLVQALTVVVVTSASVGAFYLRDHLRSLAGYGYVAVFVVGLISNATVILPIPGLAVSSLMGGVFNPWLVGLAGGMGQALGELSGYMVGYSGQRLVDGDSPYRLLSSWMRRHGAVTIFLLALVPNPLFDLGGIAAGAFRFPIWKFLVSCAVGKVIKNTAFALAGYYGADALLRFLEAP